MKANLLNSSKGSSSDVYVAGPLLSPEPPHSGARTVSIADAEANNDLVNRASHPTPSYTMTSLRPPERLQPMPENALCPSVVSVGASGCFSEGASSPQGHHEHVDENVPDKNRISG